MIIFLSFSIAMLFHLSEGSSIPIFKVASRNNKSSIKTDSLEKSIDSNIEILSKKVAMDANIPIFEFSREMTEILNQAKDDNDYIDQSIITDLELVFYDYMIKLRGHYYHIYQRTASSIGLQLNNLILSEERDHCLRECEKAMLAALPALKTTGSWGYQVQVC